MNKASHPQCLTLQFLTLSVSLFSVSPSVSSVSQPQCLTVSHCVSLSVSPSVSLSVSHSVSHSQCPLCLTLSVSQCFTLSVPSVSPSVSHSVSTLSVLSVSHRHSFSQTFFMSHKLKTKPVGFSFDSTLVTSKPLCVSIPLHLTMIKMTGPPPTVDLHSSTTAHCGLLTAS